MKKGSKQVLIIAILLTIAALILIGYVSAYKKSEPEYLSKIDKIMFDKKNKSPKFILTLPDKTEKAKEEPNIQPTEVVEEKKEAPSVNDLLNTIPLLSKLSPLADLKPLPVIECSAEFVEKEGNLSLPKINTGGIKPWMEYGKIETVQPNFRKVAVIIKNVGLDITAANVIINSLPSNVSFSFSPYTANAEAMIKDARSKGHETYADLLLPSRDVLKSDNGPMALSLTLPIEENLARVKHACGINAPLGGVVINDGVADEDNEEQLRAVLEELKNRGMLAIDATSTAKISQIRPQGLARKKAEIVIEGNITPQRIKEQLEQAEKLALDNGQVMVVAVPKPIVLNAVSEWLKTFSPQLTYEQIKEGNVTIEKPLALVPASNLVVE